MVLFDIVSDIIVVKTSLRRMDSPRIRATSIQNIPMMTLLMKDIILLMIPILLFFLLAIVPFSFRMSPRYGALLTSSI